MTLTLLQTHFDIKSTSYREETGCACLFEESKQEQVAALPLTSAADVMATVSGANLSIFEPVIELARISAPIFWSE